MRILLALVIGTVLAVALSTGGVMLYKTAQEPAPVTEPLYNYGSR